MRNLMDKINHFEKRTTGTVSDFNATFATKLEGLDQSLEVEIGELADTDTTRFLTIGTKIVKHDFTPIPTEEIDGYETTRTLPNGKVINIKVEAFKRVRPKKMV